MEVKSVPKWRPREDFVLVQISQTKPGIIQFPQQSMESQTHTVLAVGPKVEHLQAGDEVLSLSPSSNPTHVNIPGRNDVYIIRQDNVALVKEAGVFGE